jgi:hypothetical protein
MFLNGRRQLQTRKRISHMAAMRKSLRTTLESGTATVVGALVGGYTANPFAAIAASTGTYAMLENTFGPGDDPVEEEGISDVVAHISDVAGGYIYPPVPEDMDLVGPAVQSNDGTNTVTSTTQNQMRMRKSTRKTRRVPKSYKSKRYGKMVLTRGPTYAPEVKHFDAVFAGNLPVTATWGIAGLPCIPTQGTDFTNRIGRKIKVVAYQVMMTFYTISAGQVPRTGTTILCDLWEDKETKGTLAAATDIYQTNDCTDFPNATNMKRFKRLHRMKHDVSVQQVDPLLATEIVNMVETNETGRIPFNMGVNFVSNTGAIADVMDNGVVLALSTTTGMVGGAAGFAATVRLRYWFVDQ